MTSESEFQHNVTERVTRRVTDIVTKAVMFVIFGAMAIFICGEAVQLLWNWLMPALFHLPIIGFWQAVGLLFLSWLLFGGRRGFGGRAYGYRRRWRHRMRERWEQMTPEEREKFRQGLHSCWGRVTPPDTKPST
jgi:uncharacterized membrane protein YbhN (UPF0104 family)